MLNQKARGNPSHYLVEKGENIGNPYNTLNYISIHIKFQAICNHKLPTCTYTSIGRYTGTTIILLL